MSDWGDSELQRLGSELGSVELSDEDEAMFDAQADEAETDDWLAAWSDDFHSDEWLAAFLNPQQAVPIS